MKSVSELGAPALSCWLLSAISVALRMMQYALGVPAPGYHEPQKAPPQTVF